MSENQKIGKEKVAKKLQNRGYKPFLYTCLAIEAVIGSMFAYQYAFENDLYDKVIHWNRYRAKENHISEERVLRDRQHAFLIKAAEDNKITDKEVFDYASMLPPDSVNYSSHLKM